MGAREEQSGNKVRAKNPKAAAKIKNFKVGIREEQSGIKKPEMRAREEQSGKEMEVRISKWEQERNKVGLRSRK